MTPSSDRPAMRLTRLAVLTALSLILSALERPLLQWMPLPGFKLGFANIVTLYTIYRFGRADAAICHFSRIGLGALLFGTPVSFVLSLSGGLCAYGITTLLYQNTRLSPFGVSTASAAAHMLGQICAAAVILRTALLFAAYLPYLLLLSVFSGLLCGLLTAALLRIRIR